MADGTAPCSSVDCKDLLSSECKDPELVESALVKLVWRPGPEESDGAGLVRGCKRPGVERPDELWLCCRPP